MKKKTRKVLALVCSAILLVAIAVGATVAYLTDDDAVVNTFTVGNVQIKLDEADVDNSSDADRDQANAYHLLPGQTYTKDPTVTVLEGSEKCYVKMTVAIDKAAELDAIFAPTGANMISIFNGYDSTKWIDKGNTKSGDIRTYEFWYATTVDASAQEKELEALFESITVPGTITGEQLATIDGMTITVNAYAIQADGFDTADLAWAAFPNT